VSEWSIVTVSKTVVR